MITNPSKTFVMCITLCLYTVLISNSVSADSRFGLRGKSDVIHNTLKHSGKFADKIQRSENPRLKKHQNSKHHHVQGKHQRQGNHQINKRRQAKHNKEISKHEKHFSRKKRHLVKHHRGKSINPGPKQNPPHRSHKPANDHLDHATNRRKENNHHNRQYPAPTHQVKHQQSHRHKYPRYVKKQHRHKSRHFKYYKRNKHEYFRTPWYNTYYVAPMYYHYHPIGHRVQHLPSYHITIHVGGFPYFYFGGVFYRPIGNRSYIVVGAPIGAYVETLPLGFIAFTIGPNTFYFINDTYYVWDDSQQGYYVIEKPEGADQAIDDATNGRMYIYPKREQSKEQQFKDRYECHRWAVTETDIDPSLDEDEPDAQSRVNYFRAMTACLEGRGYAVK